MSQAHDYDSPWCWCHPIVAPKVPETPAESNAAATAGPEATSGTPPEVDQVTEPVRDRAARGHEVLVWGPAAEGERTSSGHRVREGWVWCCECGEFADGFPGEDAADAGAEAHEALIAVVTS